MPRDKDKPSNPLGAAFSDPFPPPFDSLPQRPHPQLDSSLEKRGPTLGFWKRLSIAWSIFASRSRIDYEPLCPYCHTAMVDLSQRRQEPLRSVYGCRNQQCYSQPRYRRVDLLDETISAQDDARNAQLAEIQRAHYRLAELETRATRWCRARVPHRLTGEQHPIEVILDLLNGIETTSDKKDKQ